MTSIPTMARRFVKTRFNESCTRCGVRSPTGQWHHRRSRSVVDEHTHHPCNGVWLCLTCHRWVHEHPFDARRVGLIVSRHTKDPSSVPVTTFIGVMHLKCDRGLFKFV